jgi:hypothetical protein
MPSQFWPGLEQLGLRYLGPGPEAGSVPTVFAFALSALMTLEGGAIALPAELLAARGVRVLALDLPHHKEGVDPQTALGQWAHDLQRGVHPMRQWGDGVEVVLEELSEAGLFGSLSFYGISRGGLAAAWVATHLNIPEKLVISRLCAWAPLVRLSRGKDFQQIAHLPAVQELDCSRWVERMTPLALKVWIGNLDLRVGVQPSFEWVEGLAQAQQRAGHRLCRSELVIRPSIGHMGHGTCPEAFQEGIEWLLQH